MPDPDMRADFLDACRRHVAPHGQVFIQRQVPERFARATPGIDKWCGGRREVTQAHLDDDLLTVISRSSDVDTRDGFRHGGWAQANDPEIGAAMSERMGQEFSWLFGRRSYDDMLTYWNQAGGPFKVRSAGGGTRSAAA